MRGQRRCAGEDDVGKGGMYHLLLSSSLLLLLLLLPFFSLNRPATTEIDRRRSILAVPLGSRSAIPNGTRPYRTVHTGPPTNRYTDRSLLGDTIDWACFHPITVRNRSVTVDFDHRHPLSLDAANEMSPPRLRRRGLGIIDDFSTTRGEAHYPQKVLILMGLFEAKWLPRQPKQWSTRKGQLYTKGANFFNKDG
ncbi:hypothetical protein B296_00030714 [Ensete ventricosum]|uniref:Uncharacterized protein n=1 Tax=Ensete ventricosum TaxID=4639 RepID=A0A426ZJ65_ENSVE|nr:hypothetical protein B296_00030714 [Ensete ventricosum]